MTLDEFLMVGEDVHLGSHRFDAAEIKAFASRYDPQPFHIDEEAAKDSVLGGLCASGWHTASVWMQLNIKAGMGAAWTGSGPAPVFGPSPGFRNLRWPKPVYAGETISFARRATGHRPLASKPGWRIATHVSTAENGRGDKVMEFDGAVLVRGS